MRGVLGNGARLFKRCERFGNARFEERLAPRVAPVPVPVVDRSVVPGTDGETHETVLHTPSNRNYSRGQELLFRVFSRDLNEVSGRLSSRSPIAIPKNSTGQSSRDGLSTSAVLNGTPVMNV
jgi:hypothetical protein